MAKFRLSRLTIAAIAPLALLAACGDEAPEETAAASDDGREASGEILPSSISDEMIATDQLSSQPPLLQDEPASGDGSGAGDASAIGDDAETGGGDAEGGEPDAASPPSDEAVSLPED